MSQGVLYIIPTPIGNLEDITLRALRILKEVDVLASEDTRHTQKLLSHFEISKVLTSYHDFNKEEKAPVLLQFLKEGRNVGLVCDAGTPTISDPGYLLINQAIAHGIKVIPLPGPSAVLTALSGSGLPTDAFIFNGFLPKKKTARLKVIEELKEEKKTLIFFETPHRIVTILEEVYSVFGERRVVIARELTKKFEEFIYGPLSGIIQKKWAVKGEITLLIEGKRKKILNASDAPEPCVTHWPSRLLHFILAAVIVLWLGQNPVRAEDTKINVVTTLPVLKDFVDQVGQNRVTVTSLLTGMESEHTYTPKPSDILAIKKAQILVQIGLGLEVWVQGLIVNAENAGLRVITTSQGIPLIREEEKHLSTGDANAHEGGNPHIWLDPENAKNMVREITEGLIKKDPAGKEIYLKNQGIYLMKLDRLETSLLGELKNIRNKTVITQHPAWPYFARRFGLKIAGNIVTQIGTEPSAKQIKELIRLIRKNNIRVIIAEPQLSPKIPQVLASETGAKLITLSPLTGAIPGTETYLSLIEYNVRQIIEAARP